MIAIAGKRAPTGENEGVAIVMKNEDVAIVREK
jgi:hypothetical protein